MTLITRLQSMLDEHELDEVHARLSWHRTFTRPFVSVRGIDFLRHFVDILGAPTDEHVVRIVYASRLDGLRATVDDNAIDSDFDWLDAHIGGKYRAQVLGSLFVYHCRDSDNEVLRFLLRRYRHPHQLNLSFRELVFRCTSESRDVVDDEWFEHRVELAEARRWVDRGLGRTGTFASFDEFERLIRDTDRDAKRRRRLTLQWHSPEYCCV